ncbi:hypothetical protein Alg130_06686 [Pyrenophora tritici-repentis]|nr:hypothetical protein Alg130_06686 [Pyrenophora tritici-repentis]KAI0606436.1 hypothetical protein TUN205_09319 [Pyrenophora tritici-repentis]
MSDYEDEYDDYEADFFYVEDEYMAADDLAEHAVASPPPATCGDEDAEEDWDRFDYFNDLEYASDGYDDATFQAHDVKGAKAGMKRKRGVKSLPATKRRTTKRDSAQTEPTAVVAHSPIVWRSQADRGAKPKMLEENAQPYALFKNWREKLAHIPEWAKASPPSPPGAESSRLDKGKGRMAFVTEPASPPYDDDDHVGDEIEEGEDVAMDEEPSIDKDTLMAALQRQLAAAGGPLSNMDHNQLLEYALRMMSDQDAGDDIAGEMADAMLQGGDDDEDDTEAEEKMLEWVARQRNGGKDEQPVQGDDGDEDDTGPQEKMLERDGGVDERDTVDRADDEQTAVDRPPKHTLKRKAEQQLDEETGSKQIKKRVTRSFDKPTEASLAKAAKPEKAEKPATRSSARLR